MSLVLELCTKQDRTKHDCINILIWSYLNKITFWASLFIRFASFLFVASWRKDAQGIDMKVRPDDLTSARMLPVTQTKCPLFRFFLLLLCLSRYKGKAGKGTPMQNLAFPPNMSVRTLRPLPAFCSFSSSCWMTSWKSQSRIGAQLPWLFPHAHIFTTQRESARTQRSFIWIRFYMSLGMYHVTLDCTTYIISNNIMCVTNCLCVYVYIYISS